MKPGNDDLLKMLRSAIPVPPKAETHPGSTERAGALSQVPPKERAFDHLKAEPKGRKEPRTVYLSTQTLDRLRVMQGATGRSLTVLVERLLEEALEKYF